MNNPEFFNSLDYAFLFILFGSIFLGFVRGFTKDFFGTFAWIGSGIIATIMGPYVALNLKHNIANPFVAKCVALLLSYIVILVTLNLLINMFSRKVKASFLSGIDRLFGSLFGCARGIGLLICIPVLLLMFGIPQSQLDITKNSKIATILYKIAAKLMPRISRATGIRPIRVSPETQLPTAVDFSKIPIKKKEEKKEKQKPIIELPEVPNIVEQTEKYVDALAERYLQYREESQKLHEQQQQSAIIESTPNTQQVNTKRKRIYNSDTRYDIPYEQLNRRQKARYENDKYRFVRPKYGIMNLMDAKERRLRELRKKKLKEVIQKKLSEQSE